MPISTNFSGSHWLISQYQQKLDNPDPALFEMADELVQDIDAMAPRDTETLVEIATKVRGPYNTPGGRAIGVGDATRVAARNVVAPKGTIAEFLKDFGGPRRKPPDKSWAWWYLSKRQKEALDAARRQGKYGGQPGKAPYFWVQEYGDLEAQVEPQLFVWTAVRNLVAKIPAIIDRHFHAR